MNPGEFIEKTVSEALAPPVLREIDGKLHLFSDPAIHNKKFCEIDQRLVEFFKERGLI